MFFSLIGCEREHEEEEEEKGKWEFLEDSSFGLEMRLLCRGQLVRIPFIYRRSSSRRARQTLRASPHGSFKHSINQTTNQPSKRQDGRTDGRNGPAWRAAAVQGAGRAWVARGLGSTAAWRRWSSCVRDRAAVRARFAECGRTRFRCKGTFQSRCFCVCGQCWRTSRKKL